MVLDMEFLEHVMGELSGISGISSRAMFGGAGIFSGGKMFALIYAGTLYFKVDRSNENEYILSMVKSSTESRVFQLDNVRGIAA